MGSRFSLVFGVQGRPLPTPAVRRTLGDAKKKAAEFDMFNVYSGASEYYQPVRLEVRRWSPSLTNLDAIEALDELDKAVNMGRWVGDGLVVEFFSGGQVRMKAYFQQGLQ